MQKTGKPVASAQENQSTRILVVDDDEIILIALAETLRHEGYLSVTTQSPREALEILKSKPFSVIISDQRMAEMNGLDFLQEAAKIQPTASRILITGILTLKTVIDAINSGEIFRFVAKPWLREELLATVRNAAQRHELLETNRRLQESTLRLNAQLSETNSLLQQKIRELTTEKNNLVEAHAKMQATFEQSLDLTQRIVSVYLPRLGEETREVSALCDRMLDFGTLSAEERHVLRIASRIYNVGFVGLARDLLERARRQPQSLSENDRRVIEDAAISSQILSSFVDSSDSVGRTVRACRERWDGSGRPDGLQGEAIPVPARILAVAVWFVESPLGRTEKVDEILHLSGSAFDPAAASLFIKALRTSAPARGTHEVTLAQLRSGMVLAAGIFSPSGMLLAGEGQRITDGLIEKIRQQKEGFYDGQKLMVYY